MPRIYLDLKYHCMVTRTSTTIYLTTTKIYMRCDENYKFMQTDLKVVEEITNYLYVHRCIDNSQIIP